MRITIAASTSKLVASQDIGCHTVTLTCDLVLFSETFTDVSCQWLDLQAQMLLEAEVYVTDSRKAQQLYERASADQ